MFRWKFLMAAIVAGIAALAGPATSQAAYELRLSSNGEIATLDLTTVTTGAGTIGSGTYTGSSSGGGVVTLTGIVFQGYTISTNLTFSNSPGSPGLAQLSLSDTSIQRTAALTNNGTLSIAVSATDYSSPTGFTTNNTAFQTLYTPNNANGTVTLTSHVDLTNSLFGAGNTQSDTATTSFSSPINTQALPSINGLFSMTNEIQVSGLAVAVNNLPQIQASVDSTVIVPAPAGLILAATALPFVGLLRRRLRKPEATTAA
jgi:hypothetical protein